MKIVVDTVPLKSLLIRLDSIIGQKCFSSAMSPLMIDCKDGAEQICFSLNSPIAKFRESLPCTCGEKNRRAVHMAFNPNFFLPILKVISSEKVCVFFHERLQPIFISPAENMEGVKSVHVVLPVNKGEDNDNGRN